MSKPLMLNPFEVSYAMKTATITSSPIMYRLDNIAGEYTVRASLFQSPKFDPLLQVSTVFTGNLAEGLEISEELKLPLTDLLEGIVATHNFFQAQHQLTVKAISGGHNLPSVLARYQSKFATQIVRHALHALRELQPDCENYANQAVCRVSQLKDLPAIYNRLL